MVSFMPHIDSMIQFLLTGSPWTRTIAKDLVGRIPYLEAYAGSSIAFEQADKCQSMAFLGILKKTVSFKRVPRKEYEQPAKSEFTRRLKLITTQMTLTTKVRVTCEPESLKDMPR